MRYKRSREVFQDPALRLFGFIYIAPFCLYAGRNFHFVQEEFCASGVCHLVSIRRIGLNILDAVFETEPGCLPSRPWSFFG